ncbi:MAG: hypothetical protein ACHQ50_00790 [Fimbriimonadales bacterium]
MRRFISLALTISLVSAAASSGAQEVIHSVYHNNTSVRGLIQSVETESNSFRAGFEKKYKGRFVPDWRKTDRSLKAIQALDKSLEVLERRNEGGEKPKYLRDDVKKVAARAQELDRLFHNADDLLETMRPAWRHLRTDIDTLASVYDLPERPAVARSR